MSARSRQRNKARSHVSRHGKRVAARAGAPTPSRRALEAVAWMRKGKSLTHAARLAHTKAATVRKYAGQAVALVPPGRCAARSSDRLARDLRFLTDEGAIVVRVRSARDASAVARHASAVRRFFETGETKALRPFAGKVLRAGRRTFRYITDPHTLARLGSVGEVRYDELYASVR